MKILSVFLILCSCSVFKTFDVSKNLSRSTKKICLSGEGKGRLGVDNKKYVFQYESGLDMEHANWKLALNFPLQKTEIFELDWSKNGQVEFSSSIDEKLLRENGKVNPVSLDFFSHSIGHLIQEIISLNNPQQKNAIGSISTHTSENRFSWKQNQKSLIATNKMKNFEASFKNMVGNQYFGLIKIKYIDDKKQEFKMDLVVKDCFL